MKQIMIVTGASSGMGVCFAKQLALESATFRLMADRLLSRGKTKRAQEIRAQSADELWIIARRAERLEETKQLIENDAAAWKASHEGQAAFPAVRAIPLDIGGKAGAMRVRELLRSEEACSGKPPAITVLVNNAGFGTYGPFEATDPVREMDMVDLDCTALTGITGFALPYMGPGARIINTASLASFLPLGNFAVYGACKAYVLSFSVALAAELRERGVRVTALCPGPVSTEFANVASRGARTEVRHGLSPEKTVAHCLSRSRKGRLYALWAFRWKFQAAASRWVPRFLGAWFTYRFCKRPSR